MAGLRERKADKTRLAVLNAALDLFESSGYETTTMDEVAAAAGVSRRTLFRYVDGKDDLLFGHHPEWVAAFERGIAEAGDVPLEIVLRHASQVVCAHISTDPDRVLRAMAVAVRTPSVSGRLSLLDHQWQQLVADVATSGGVTHLRSRLVAGAIMGMISAVLAGWAQSGGTLDLSIEIASGFDLLAGGVFQ